VAAEARALERQGRPVAVGGIGVGQRQVAAPEDADHPGHRPGGAVVDADDPGVGVRAQDQAGVQHARPLDIAREADEPGDLGRPVGPRQRAADLTEALARRHRSCVPYNCCSCDRHLSSSSCA
jgi:hypothetical protein